MLDQMFSAENFRRIFDYENRKGNDLAKRFFPDVFEQTIAIKEQVTNLRELRSKRPIMSATAYAASESTLKELIRKLKSEKSLAVDRELEELSLRIANPAFSIAIEKKDGPANKSVFCIDDSAEAFFVVKQIQRNIHKLYSVKQSNRHDLLCQVRETLSSNFPFQIVRTDISSFYESIDQTRLLKKLDDDQLLSFTSKKFVNQIVNAYLKEAATNKGIPRGVGISSYLAELYLRQVDREIKLLEGLVIYCRFVDDIVAVFARPPRTSVVSTYKDSIIKILSDQGLQHNQAKTFEFDLSTQTSFCFDYLGYQFNSAAPDSHSPRLLKVLPSTTKIDKLKKRIELSFEVYERQRCYDSRGAFRDLVARMKFLTGNTRLSNSKSNAHTGVFYNNEWVNDDKAFKDLDIELAKLISNTKHKQLKRRLKKFTFASGFDERRFHNFSFKQLQKIVRVWKHA